MLVGLSSPLRPPFWKKMLSFHLPPAGRGSSPRTSWCRPGAEAAILKKCRLFTYRQLGVAVHLEPVGADQVLRPPYWKKCRLFTYRQLSVAVHLEPVGADQVLLVEDRVVRTEEVEILELKQKPILEKLKN
jgi:hypothetical protein